MYLISYSAGSHCVVFVIIIIMRKRKIIRVYSKPFNTKLDTATVGIIPPPTGDGSIAVNEKKSRKIEFTKERKIILIQSG